MSESAAVPDAFALSYNPRDVAKLQEGVATRQLASGELALSPQNHMFCAHCAAPFDACVCEIEERPLATDYTFLHMPPPAHDATPDALLRRWCSVVKLSPSMGKFAADQWYNEHGSRSLAALRSAGAALRDMVTEFVADLPNDPNLPILARLVGLPDTPPLASVAALAAEAECARRAFLAADWGCVTKLGATLLFTSFMTSDPDKFDAQDEHLTHLFAALDVLQNVLNDGYSGIGWRLAVENDRPPRVPPPPLRAASDRDLTQPPLDEAIPAVMGPD